MQGFAVIRITVVNDDSIGGDATLSLVNCS
jgi:hypothetical protein